MLSQKLIARLTNASTLQEILSAYLEVHGRKLADRYPFLTFTDLGQTYRIVDVEHVCYDQPDNGLYNISVPFHQKPEHYGYVLAKVKVVPVRGEGNQPLQEAAMDRRDTWQILSLWYPESVTDRGTDDSLRLDYEEFLTLWENLAEIRNELVLVADNYRLARIKSPQRFSEGDALSLHSTELCLDPRGPIPVTVVEEFPVGNRSEPDLLLLQDGELFRDFSWKYDPYKG